MKISSQDEYGLRMMIQIAKADPQEGLSIFQLSEMEGISSSYVAKLTRTLRIAGLISSTRGQKGGYILNRKPGDIQVSEVLNALGGTLFDQSFCHAHSGQFRICTNSTDCTLRSLWKVVQLSVDEVLNRVTIADLMGPEKKANDKLQGFVKKLGPGLEVV